MSAESKITVMRDVVWYDDETGERLPDVAVVGVEIEIDGVVHGQTCTVLEPASDVTITAVGEMTDQALRHRLGLL